MKTETRNIHARIRLTSDEAESIAGLAQASRLTISEFMRRAALSREINAPRPLPEINRATYSELGRVSGNLQRLFSWATSDKRLPPDFARQLTDALKSVKTTCKATQQQIIGGVEHDL
jgi:hypothetical protein